VCAGLAAWAGLVVAGCGKKGPPLPPLRLVPAPATELSARRTASEVELRFTLPTRNQNGPGPIELDRIEVYAITLPPASPPAANRDLLVKERLIGTVPVRPTPEEGEPEAPVDPNDTRPEPGARAIFVEELTEEKLKPVMLKPDADASRDPKSGLAAAAKAAAGPGGGRGAPSAVAEIPEPAPDHPVRIYALRGVTRGGRPGPPAQRIVVPLIAIPSAPGGVDVRFNERQFMITWVPPVLEGAATLAFNVYAGANESIPLNATPLTAAAYEHGPVRYGDEQCFAVRTLQSVQNVTIESGPSPPTCVAPTDIFPPAAPQGLQIVAAPEGVSLSWNANTEADLAGYVVLRAEAPGETLQPLTPGPISEPTYRDTSVQSGVRYVYAIVAVDKAKPPNTSAQSERQEATAR
jgi:hypothetical protein